MAAAASMEHQLELALAVLHMQLVACHLPSVAAASVQHTSAEPASAVVSCHTLTPAPAQQDTMSKVQTHETHVSDVHVFWKRKETKRCQKLGRKHLLLEPAQVTL